MHLVGQSEMRISEDLTKSQQNKPAPTVNFEGIFVAGHRATEHHVTCSIVSIGTTIVAVE